MYTNKMPDPNWPYEDTVTIACINFHPVEGDKLTTLDKIKDFAVKAAIKGANIIIFPEIALGNIIISPELAWGEKAPVGAPPAALVNLAETIPGPSTEEIAKLANQYNMHVIFGMVEREEDSYYNSAAVIGPSGVLGTYRKVHYRAPWEKAWLSKGNSFPIFKTPYGPLGIGICYESYCMPEVARCYAVRGVRLFINVTAFPKFPDCQDYREFYMTTLGCRSIENQMFIASANVVGELGGMTHFGNSVILGPKPGYMNYYVFAGPASDKEEEIVNATLNLRSVKNLPFAVAGSLKDRMPQLYNYLVKRNLSH